VATMRLPRIHGRASLCRTAARSRWDCGGTVTYT